jgi:hypothetical protein
MVQVKKSTTSGGAEGLDILAARLRIVEAELTLEEKNVKMDNGHSFMAEPNLNCKIEVVKNLVEPGMHEGAVFYDRFKLKKDKNGDWVFAKYSKLGNLIKVRYGEKWFESDDEFDEEDFEEFDFIAGLAPKEDKNGKQIPGTTVNWKSMRPIAAEAVVMREREERIEIDEEEDGEDLDF